MNSVPFLFCDNVVSTICKLPPLETLSDRCPVWKSAFADHVVNRRCLRMFICLGEDGWGHLFTTEGRSQSLRFCFDDVRRLEEKYLQIENVSFVLQSAPKIGFATSIEKISEICKCVIPSFNETTLYLQWDSAQQDAIDVLALFNDAPFRNILALKSNDAFEDFLRNQMQSDCLKCLGFGDVTCPPALQADYDRFEMRTKGYNRGVLIKKIFVSLFVVFVSAFLRHFL